MLGLEAGFAALTWPLVTRPLTAVVSHWDADIEHSLWSAWWFVYALAAPDTGLFRSDMLSHPQVASFQLADLNLAVLVVAGPLARAIGPAAAYNALLLASFLASAGLCARLARRLGAGSAPAWVAGIAFATSPYWQCCALNGWGYLVHIWVFPLSFLALERARRLPGAASAAGVGLCLTLAFHVTPYYFVYLVLCTSLYLAPDMARALQALPTRELARRALAFALPLLLGVVPRALPMWRDASGPLVAHHSALNTQLAASVSELFWPSSDAVASRVPRIGYEVVFLGWALPLTVALGGWLAPARELYARFALPACASLLLALGPDLKLVDGRPLGVTLPAHFLQQLPGLSITTNHWRWILPVWFCGCALLGPAASEVLRALRRRRPGLARPALAALALALGLELLWLAPLPRVWPLWPVRVAPVAPLLRDLPDVRALVDRTRTPKLNQMAHGRPLALAWLPRWSFDVHAARARMAAECRDLAPDCLVRHGVDAVILSDRLALQLRREGDRVVARELRAP